MEDVQIAEAIPSCAFQRDEEVLRSSKKNGQFPREAAWLLALEEALYAMSVPRDCQVIIIRTNIRKLDALIKRDLYSEHTSTVSIAQSIHERLLTMAREGQSTPFRRYPIELRSSLLY